MNLEKLFGSKTKSDILKYLVFRRQGVSIRALESELGWTFPGIKKQIDSLEEAEVLQIEKTPEKRSIKIAEDVYEEIRKLIICSLKHDTKQLLDTCQIISKYYLGKIFDKQIDVDLVVLYEDDGAEYIPKQQGHSRTIEQGKGSITPLLDGNVEDLEGTTSPSGSIETLELLKQDITTLFKKYMIDPAYLVFMPSEEFNKRTKMADKFALNVLRNSQG